MINEIFSVRGGRKLFGSYTVHGAKNAVLPLLASSVLTEKSVTVRDCPDITDVTAMVDVLRALGMRVHKSGRNITVSGTPCEITVPPHLSGVMRSSMFMLGSLLTKNGEVRLKNPGGCKIGKRPLDIHLDGLQLMGATVETGDDYVHCYARRLQGADILMRYPSVGATENLMMSAVLAKGSTSLIGCAREPEIVCLAEALRSMGARIRGEGTSVIKIDGVDELDGAAVTPVEDRIYAGTLLACAAIAGGDIEICNINARYLNAVLVQLSSPHCCVSDKNGIIRICGDGIVLPTEISTGPYPLFPTDMQAQLMACQCAADGGVSVMRETVFENRFAHVAEFAKMGVKIALSNQTATVYGSVLKPSLNLVSSDLRGGAGLVTAALKADGESAVSGVEYIDRGYEKFETALTSLGADIKRKQMFV